MKKFWETARPYILIIVFVVLARTFIVTPAKVNGDSMEPTLNDGEIAIVNKIVYALGDIKRYDMVVIKHEGETLIKRVIGLPNEKIEYSNNELYINGFEVKAENIEFEDTQDFIYETKEGEYYVLGDNRDISKDSRSFGPFKRNEIIGKVNLIIFPFKSFGMKN